MTTSADELRDRLRVVLGNMQSDPTRLARQINRSKDYIRDFLDGRKDSISAIALGEIERVAELNEGELVRFSSKKDRYTRVYYPDYAKSASQLAISNLNIPLFPLHEDINSNQITINRNQIGWVRKPAVADIDEDAFAVLVEGEAMIPAYEPGDVLTVSALIGNRRGCDSIIFSDVFGKLTIEGGTVLAKIVRLVDFNRKTITAQQYNPVNELVLNRADWPQMLRIIARLNRV